MDRNGKSEHRKTQRRRLQSWESRFKGMPDLACPLNPPDAYRIATQNY